MNTPTLKTVLRLFEELGIITARTMLGGFGIFCDGTNFALVVNDVLYIRSTPNTLDYLTSMGFQQYIYQNRGNTIVTSYYAIPKILWEDPLEILSIGTVALRHAKVEQQKITAEENKTVARSIDLPKINSRSEGLLKNVSVDSVDNLQKTGAGEAFNVERKPHSNRTSISSLWSTEGVIEELHWSGLSRHKKDEMMYQINDSLKTQSVN